MMIEAALETRIMDAHGRGDHRALVYLYSAVADDHMVRDKPDAACYFWTLAYVFALQEGMDAVETLHRKLVDHGREK